MKKMYKKMAAFAVAACLCILALGGCSSGGKESDSIKVGVLFSKTGATATVEQVAYNTTLMAIDEINEAGGISGKKLVPVYEDYASDAATAAEKMKKLNMEDEVVATVGLLTSASRIACEPVLEENDSLLFYPTYYEGEKPSDNVIYTGCTANQQGDVMLPYMMENVGKNVFILATNTVYCLEVANLAETVIQNMGGNLAGSEFVDWGTEDYSTILTEIIDKKPDFIYCMIGDTMGVAFYKQYAAYGLSAEQIPIANLSMDETMLAALDPAVSEGQYACKNYMNTLDNEKNKEFVDNYVERYGTETVVNDMGEAAYDSVYLLAQALTRLDSEEKDFTAENIVSIVSGMEFAAPQGQIKIDDTNHHIWCRSRIYQINNEGFPAVMYETPDLVEPKPEG